MKKNVPSAVYVVPVVSRKLASISYFFRWALPAACKSCRTFLTLWRLCQEASHLCQDLSQRDSRSVVRSKCFTDSLREVVCALYRDSAGSA